MYAENKGMLNPISRLGSERNAIVVRIVSVGDAVIWIVAVRSGSHAVTVGSAKAYSPVRISNAQSQARQRCANRAPRPIPTRKVLSKAAWT